MSNEFDFRDFDELYDSWTHYEGNFIKNEKNGDGVLYLSNGEKIQGVFVHDKLTGKAIFFKKDGQKIVGDWEDNKLKRVY